MDIAEIIRETRPIKICTILINKLIQNILLYITM